MQDSDRLIGRKELLKRVPFSIQHLGRLEKSGKFPRRIQVGEHRVGWLVSEIEAWLAAKVAARAEREAQTARSGG